MKDSQVYSEMLALQSVNVSCSMLTSITRHLFLAPKASSIDISGTKVCEVPCLGFESLKVVRSSPCVTKANWSLHFIQMGRDAGAPGICRSLAQ